MILFLQNSRKYKFNLYLWENRSAIIRIVKKQTFEENKGTFWDKRNVLDCGGGGYAGV